MNQSISLVHTNLTETPGRDLLHLLRRRDKLIRESDADSTENTHIKQTILNLLSSLDTSIQRTGLLSPSAIEKINAQKDSSNVTVNSEGGKKRKRKGGDRANGTTASQYGIYLECHTENGDKVDLEEGRVVMGLCRILGVGKKSKQEENVVETEDADDGLEIVGAASHVVTSICDHAIHGNGLSCSIVKDMIGSINVPLIGRLIGLIQMLEDASAVAALVSALRAAASVISLVQSRCTNGKAGEKAVQNLRVTTWSVLNSAENSETIKAAATLLATLPLAGDASTNNSLSAAWAKCVTEGILLLKFAISDVFPVNEKDKEGNLKDPMTDSFRQDHQTWLQSLNGSIDESADNGAIDAHRRDKFLSRVQSLTDYLLSLIKMQGYPTNQDSHVLFVNLPLQVLLDTSETLLSFPLAAEIKHRSLPSRLRSSPVDGGLISANAAACIASSMRYCGHLIFDTAVSSCRGGAYSKARRIIAISTANLQSSVSRGLLSVVVEGRKVDGRKNGITTHLRGSIPLRIKSVEMFRTVMMALGSGVMSSGTSKSVCRSVILVGGCLLEQIQRCCCNADGDVSLEEEWGTLEERGILIETCSDTLASSIVACGGLIPNNVRGTVDSIIHTCLSTMYSVGSSPVFAYTRVKQSLLQLGMNSVCMPWGDGGRSALLEMVRTVALVLRSDSDVSVASAALSTMCAFDGYVTPRAPALVIPSRETISDNPNILSADGIVEGIRAAAVELVAAAGNETHQTKMEKTHEINQKYVDESRNGAPASTSNETKPINGKGLKPNTTSKPDSNVPAVSITKAEMDVDSNDKKVDVSAAHGDIIPMELSDGKCINDKAPAKDPIVTTAIVLTKHPEKDEQSGDESSSMGDFPEIVDEDPDEEDRV